MRLHVKAERSREGAWKPTLSILGAITLRNPASSVLDRLRSEDTDARELCEEM